MRMVVAFEDLRPVLLQPAGQWAGLFEAARDDDSLPEKRAPLEPVELLAQLHHFANDGDGRRADLLFGGHFGDGAEGPYWTAAGPFIDLGLDLVLPKTTSKHQQRAGKRLESQDGAELAVVEQELTCWC